MDQSGAQALLDLLELNCTDFGIPLVSSSSPDRGIVHVVAPELGFVQPGMTVVCGDSHTSTLGALGALSLGISTGQVAQVLATQCLLVKRPLDCEVRIEGSLASGVSAKDVALFLLARIGQEGHAGCVVEFTGSTIRRMSVEDRMTLCNMSVEGGARSALISPDETTISYLRARRHSPLGAAWQDSVERWRGFASDDGAIYDCTVQIDVDALEPMVTWGTRPCDAIPISEPIPDPAIFRTQAQSDAARRSLAYMGFRPGADIRDEKVDVVFIGSCTNSRLSDLRRAAGLVRGRSVARNVRLMVVPGSEAVKRAAESEGLDQTFVAAGGEWHGPGCSMCSAINGDRAKPGALVVSTGNRNFEGRQGPGVRTVLASPGTAIASAIAGTIADPRDSL